MIDGISDLRGEMAHLGMPPGITGNDVEDKIDNLKKIVHVIDCVVHENFVRPSKRQLALKVKRAERGGLK